MSTSNERTFRRQSRLFSRLAIEADPPYADVFGKERPSPRTVLEFVESLLVCPTEHAARVQIPRHRESAEVCRLYPNDMASASGIERALDQWDRPLHETPF